MEARRARLRRPGWCAGCSKFEGQGNDGSGAHRLRQAVHRLGEMLAAWNFTPSRAEAAHRTQSLARDKTWQGLIDTCAFLIPRWSLVCRIHPPLASLPALIASGTHLLPLRIPSRTTLAIFNAMFRRPGTSRSKASADTLCQKCLKKGHYSYECKATAQERPYQSRPSRTQQLLNPKLKPKLTTEVPEDLLRKKGVADEILKKKEAERAGRKRSRSLSTSSVDSVSTISTNRSPSRSRSPPRPKKHNGASLRGGDDKALSKRRRRSASRESRSPAGSDRNTRRRMSSFSPGERGRLRTRSRSVSQRMEISHEDARPKEPHRRHRRSSRSRSRHGKRPVRRPSPSRSRSRSPDRMDTTDDRQPRNGASRGRWGASPPAQKATSRSSSPFRPGRVRSPSPHAKRRVPSPRGGRNGHQDRGMADGPPRNRFDDGPVRQAPPVAAPPPVQRERSLSPFSKRVALTKAMQAGRM